MDDFQALCVLKGKELVEEALSAPKQEPDADSALGHRPGEARPRQAGALIVMTHIIQLPMLHTNLGLVSQAKCPVCGESSTFTQKLPPPPALPGRHGCVHAGVILADYERKSVNFWFREGD